MDPGLELLFKALEDLIRPFSDHSKGRKPTNINQVLLRNIDLAIERLQIKDIITLPSHPIYINPKCSERWRFVCLLLHILNSLKKSLCSNSNYVPTSVTASSSSPSISSSFNSSTSSSTSCASSTTSSTSTSTTSQEIPPTSHQFILPPDKEKTLRACLQFVISIGLLPNLVPYLGGLASRCSASTASIVQDEKLLDIEKYERLSAVTQALMNLCHQPIIRKLIISKHLGDFFAALAQLSFRLFMKPTIPSGEEKITKTTGDDFIMTPAIFAQLEKGRAKFKSYFKNFVEVTYQPLMIRELMLIQGKFEIDNKGKRAIPAPIWLKHPCTHMLMQCMCRPSGIESFIRVMLDAAPNTVNQPAKIDIIVKHISTPPFASSADNYLESVAPQIVDLIRRGDPIMTRIAVFCIEALLESRREFCTRRILKVFLQPLLSCTTANNINSYEFESLFLPELFTPDSGCTPLPTPTDLSQCIRALHNAWVSDNSHTAVLNGSLLRPALMVLFRLGCVLTESRSPLKELIHDLVFKHLHHCTKEELPSVYCALLFREPLNGCVDIIPRLAFVFDEPSGEIQINENFQETQNENLKWLSWSQTSNNCLISILNRDKIGELVNVLFLCLLTKSTLHHVDKYSIIGGELLAHLAGVPYVQKCIRKDPVPVVKFIKNWLDREAKLMVAFKNDTCNDCESIITALLILTTIINSSQKAKTDWEAFKVLLDPLEKIKELTNYEEIKLIATNIHRALLTHGTIWEQSLSQPPGINSTNQQSSSSTSSPIPATSATVNTNPAPTQIKESRKKAKSKKKEDKPPTGETNATNIIAETKQDKEEKKEKKTNENNNKKNKNNVQEAASILELHNADLNKILENSTAAAASAGEIGASGQNPASSSVIEAMVDACSDEIPVHGHSLIALTRLLSNMDSSVKPHIGCTPLPTPTDLSQCIRALHNAWVSDNSHTAVLNGPLLRPALMVLFRLGCVLAKSRSPLREPVHDLVFKHLQHCTKEELPSVYCALLFREPLNACVDIIPELAFVLDEHSGEIQIKENYEKTQNENLDWLTWSQTAGDCLVSILLQRDPTGELVNILFVCLLSKATLHQEDKYSIVGAKLLTVLAAIPYVQECIGTDPLPVVKLIQTWLERQANLMAASKNAEFQDWEFLITVLMILTVIINYSGTDSSQIVDTDWEAFKVLLDPLQKIKKLATSEEIKTFAADVFDALVTHGTIRKQSLSQPPGINSTNQQSSSSTSSPTPATSATVNTNPAPTQIKGRRKKAKPKKKEDMPPTGETNATNIIAETKQDKEEKKTNENNNKKNKNNVQEAASILEMHNADLNKILENSTAAAASAGKIGASGQNPASSSVIEAMVDACSDEIPVRGHSLIALTRLLSNMDSSVKPHIKKILTIMHENIRHPDSYVYLAAIRGMVALSCFEKDLVIKILIEEYTNSNPRPDKDEVDAIEYRLKIGEVLVLLMRMHGETIVIYKNLLLNAFLVGTKDPAYQIRASSLSDLAEICKELRYNVGPVINEIMMCITCLLRSDPEIEVRRAAVMVLEIMLRGLGNDIPKVLPDQMSRIYTLLKHVYQDDPDEKLRLHAQLALEEIRDFALNFMFPKPSLQKHIYIRSDPSS